MIKNTIDKKRQEGFTIIEVLIVLAIAGLIVLIVFLAVPALQRNSRNTQRKNDVSATLGAVSEFVSNNSGRLPTTAANITDITNLGFYDETTEFALQTAAGVVNQTNNSQILVLRNAVCTIVAGNDSATNAGASSRNVAVLYRVEVSNGYETVCQAT
jgi:prepilin-type N-terminal cleavage/methylation domain-containing protein